MENLDIYEALREVPKDAQRPIQAGRLKGKTDINPMWRIKALTEQFGPCGVGWYPKIKRFWLEHGASEEISAFCEIELFVKPADTWSEGIPGIGGAAFVANEKNGLYTSDECFKMAFTDAISVAAKLLGAGANVYWGSDGTKYGKDEEQPTGGKNKPKTGDKSRYDELLKIYNGDKKKVEGILEYVRSAYEDDKLTFEEMAEADWLMIKEKAEKKVSANGGSKQVPA